ncbi:LamG domain-containing protein [Rubripirellula lacrimiformis]|uniref:LamG domain-containing protein n=1 Tax=Rubripirellula lacrimiformis TaxID=1930273 RepID=UPI0011A63BF9|nr:LamG domain-containing protein [Rubripirellula lacrimiformis]
MEFKSPGDRVRIHLKNDQYQGLTMAAWIRVDGLDRKYNALFMSDGYEDGEPHWQIDQSGRLMFSVSYDRALPPGGNPDQEDRQSQVF